MTTFKHLALAGLASATLLTHAQTALSLAQHHIGKSWDFSHGPLAVSEDYSSLVHADGTPFLWIGDTAWEMFHRLTRQEAEQFLEKRRAQGFTVIQAVGLAEFDGLTRPTPEGYLPLIEDDPSRPAVKEGPDNDYWDTVDFMIRSAEQKGLYIALLPTWGDKVIPMWRGKNIFNPENAEKFGYFMGKRYGATTNIIWVLGGDRPADRELDMACWRAMAKGIKAGEKDASGGFTHLMTYHPSGGRSSSQWMHKEPWLDFNMFQSGHWAKDGLNFRMARSDLALMPQKPVLDGEPRYENHPVRGDKTHTQWFDDADIRQAAYWSLFAGSFGHTYGCHDIWMMYDGTKERQCADARTAWNKAVDLPGAWQMLHLRHLMLDEKLTAPGRTESKNFIVGDNPEDGAYIIACWTKDKDAAFVYIPTGRAVTVDLRQLTNPKGIYTWFNPRTGERITDIKPVSTNDKLATFNPPGDEARGNDWVLIIR